MTHLLLFLIINTLFSALMYIISIYIIISMLIENVENFGFYTIQHFGPTAKQKNKKMKKNIIDNIVFKQIQ